MCNNSLSTALIRTLDDDPGNRPHTASIHILDDDSLLHVFYVCRPFFTDEDGSAEWRYNVCWWYAFAHVCRRWRNVILGSATYLGLSLLCTYGTPVAHMLEHSPPLPLVVGYFKKGHELTRVTTDEEGIILTLKQHGRVRRIRLTNVATIMQKLSVVMDKEYPILESLHIVPPIEDKRRILRFPETLQAPHLRELRLQSFALPIGCQLLTTSVGLVTLHLSMVNPSTYFHPNTLIQWISLMPRLETLIMYFKFSIPHRDVESQLTHAPIITPITLPNLHFLNFRGVCSYSEALVHQITTPRLQKLEIDFFDQQTFSIPRLLQLINTTEFGLFSARFTFFDTKAGVGVYTTPGETKVHAISITVKRWRLQEQVSSMAQISDSLSQIFTAVEHLALEHEVQCRPSGEHNELDPTEWRKLLRPFSKVKTLRIHKRLVKGLSRCLGSENGELPLELLPELHEITLYGSGDARDAFTSFIDARRNAGLPVTLGRRQLNPFLATLRSPRDHIGEH